MAAGRTHPNDLITNPAAAVDPLDGTGTGPVSPGSVGEFPGAVVPFGMVQWSPDTVPNASGSGGGYSYGDSSTNGLSLTHVSGTGCPFYQDVPILPTVGSIGTDPVATSDSFTHADERASPGRYGVLLGPSGIETDLSVSTHTGIARFQFPPTDQANVLIKVADSANPVSASTVQMIGNDEVTGQVTSGQFCQTGTDYTVHFAALFDRPFSASGTWAGSSVSPGSPGCTGTGCGAYFTFDTTHQRDVRMKIALSFVSTEDALQNLRQEGHGWSVAAVAAAAHQEWNSLLGRIAVGGGSVGERRTFYTALYHSLLEPNVVSDVNGDYMGSDGHVHRATGGAEYSDFSEWDTYRSEVPLESLLVPRRMGDMVQSLVDESDQSGWLPILAIPGGDASQDSGDSADPIIASAYAFGVRNFDVTGALAAMVKGATQPETGHAFEIERQYLAQYLAQHYVDAGSLDLTSIDYSLGGSVTLEYSLDDFSIAQLAQSTGRISLARQMMQRAHNWEYLFDPTNGYVEAKGADGSFPPGPAFQPSLFEPGGQLGFEEGNPIQYTWSVPQDLSGLATLMGGDAQAVTELSAFFTQLNAGRYQPYDWAGNEPSLWSPWEFDAFAAPWRTQAVVRQIVTDLYQPGPVDEPGNDDMGAMSSWYVWAALGLYPITPGTANLVLASPLFPEVRIETAGGHRLVEHAPAASPTTPFVHGLTVTGLRSHGSPSSGSGVAGRVAQAWPQAWLPPSVLDHDVTLTFDLAGSPDTAWASSRATVPSYGEGRVPALGFTAPSGGTTQTAGQPGTVELGVQAAESGTRIVHWQASGAGLSVSPSSGTFVIGRSRHVAGGVASPCRGCDRGSGPRAITVEAGAPGAYLLEVHLRTSDGTVLPPVVDDVTVS
jgi:predicted alpha-1,2-mannosidase